ncbi:phosphoserine phosphatase, chloroplastic-like [Alnus glutinosa]|uniref:phosphoserine phosphatase, chloroplastic-like n=1 Tax=Alnus glutinosa TaxID=3517 RepID=UPI002D777655|nr:phosphoserine phosphatase, chloroplastic-like [Alnus glutinosa]
MNKSPKSLKTIAASVQPVEASKLSHLNNTLPSKVCFDVDSTVCLDEGIDELAEFGGAGKAVAEWTSRPSPGIEESVKKLEANNTTVYLISGGFRQMINVCCQ